MADQAPALPAPPARWVYAPANRYRFANGHHEHLVALPAPLPGVVASLEHDAVDLALVAAPPEAPDLLFVLHRYGGHSGWSWAPYHYHLDPPPDGLLPAPPDPAAPVVYRVVLVDAPLHHPNPEACPVAAVREVPLDHGFAAALHAALRAQAARPAITPEAFQAQLLRLRARCPLPHELLPLATARMRAPAAPA